MSQKPIYEFFAELSLADGLHFVNKPKEERLLKGKECSISASSKFFTHLHTNGIDINCVFCGCKAQSWILERGKNEPSAKPVLNIFSEKNGRKVMMNRDHIIPKSVGGSDDFANFRVTCSDCNATRGNFLNAEDLLFAKQHPELFNIERQQNGLKSLNRAIANAAANQYSLIANENIEKLKQPFLALNLI